MTCVTWNGQGFSMSWTFGEIRVKYRDKSWNVYHSLNPIIMIKQQTIFFLLKLLFTLEKYIKVSVTCVTQSWRVWHSAIFQFWTWFFWYRYKLKTCFLPANSVASRSMRGAVVDIVQHFQKNLKKKKNLNLKKKIKIQNIQNFQKT